MLLHHLLSRAAQARPEALLLVHGGQRVFYGEVESSSNRLARHLVERGVERGDRVALLVPNSARYVISSFAILKAGAIAVPLHATTDARSLERTLADCSASTVIGGPGTAERLAAAAASLPHLRGVILPHAEPGAESFPPHVFVDAETLAEVQPAEPLPDRDGIDLDRALVIYTSGSTGAPRGAVLRHLNVVANTRSIVEYLELTADDRVAVVLPFPYVYGASLLHTHVAVGGSLVLHDNMVFPNTLLDTIDREQATGFSGVPSTFAILLHRSDLVRRELPSLRYVTQAGGAMPPLHIRQLVDALPQARVFVMYGATEASARLSYLPPESLPAKAGSIGRAIPNVELTVRRDDGTECDVGEIGEIVARGSNVMEGYWNDPSSTAEVLGPHGFRTGDLARRDGDGDLWVMGRAREMIKSGAHRVSPREIEDVLLEHGSVEEAAVVGRPDEYLGEAIVAFVTVKQGVDVDPTSLPDELREHCEQRLPPHKVPGEVLVRDELPRSQAGKVDKKALREERSPSSSGIER